MGLTSGLHQFAPSVRAAATPGTGCRSIDQGMRRRCWFVRSKSLTEASGAALP